jgi:ArsR family transcriptional regulator, arsenate/arsenite/antimonite-responsive transcriptional repressor
MSKTPIKSNLEDYERLFLSLGDKTRLKLLSLMANEPVSVGFLVDELGESQPKVSRHLAYLRNSGVVNTRREGKNIYYGIQESGDPDIDNVVNFVIRTMSGKSPVESLKIKKSRQSRIENEDHVNAEIKKAELESATDHENQDPHIELEAQRVDYVHQEEEEEVFFVESEPDDSELEIFLL